MSRSRRLRVLVLAREFPNPAKSRAGLWVRAQAQALRAHADVRVIAPVPRVPPGPMWGLWSKLRAVPAERDDGGLRVYSPRQWVGLGQSLVAYEGETYARAARDVIREIRAEFPFDLVHAHFVHPDGWAAARLAEEAGVPFVITEHAFWRPCMAERPRVREKAVEAARAASRIVAVSEAVRLSMLEFVPATVACTVIPNGVDSSIFRTDGAGPPDGDSILYVGWLTYHKGLDVLLRALPAIVRERPRLRLTVVGRNYFRSQRRQEREIRALAERTGVESRIDWAGGKTPHEVAAHMRAAALLVLPSRRETFGATIVEALACGRPVVATRCGGPAEILTPDLGVLVPPEDPDALAAGVLEVLRSPSRFDPRTLSAVAHARYDWRRIAERLAALYEEALRG